MSWPDGLEAAAMLKPAQSGQSTDSWLKLLLLTDSSPSFVWSLSVSEELTVEGLCKLDACPLGLARCSCSRSVVMYVGGTRVWPHSEAAISRICHASRVILLISLWRGSLRF